MSLIDSLFLTLINTVACIIFPKLLSTLIGFKQKQLKSQLSDVSLEPQEEKTEETKVLSYPY